MTDQSQRYAAKIFGITYLLSLAVIMLAFSRFYAPYLVWEKATLPMVVVTWTQIAADGVGRAAALKGSIRAQRLP